MGAFTFLTTILAPSKNQVKSNPRRCLRNRLGENRCNLCLRVCPTGALSYVEGSLHFTEENCSRCMVCTAICPVDALMPNLDLQLFVDQAKDLVHTSLTVSCEHNRLFHKDELLVPCLGIFSHELLVSFASALPHRVIRFNTHGCRNCRNMQASLRFQQNLAIVLKYNTATSAPAMELVADAQGEQTQGEQTQGDRRSFFKVLQRGAVNAAASSRTAAKKEERQQTATSRTISSRGALLRKVLESDDSPHLLAAQMVPRLHISSSCDLCPRCAGICPTGALKLVRLEKGKRLEFDGTSCCGCALCIDFCKKDALALSCTLQS